MSSWPPAGRAGPAGAGIGGSLWNHAWFPRAPGLQGECVSEGMGVLDTDWQTVLRKVTPIPTWQLVPTPSLGLCSAASWGQLCVSGQGTKGFVFKCSWSLSLLALPTVGDRHRDMETGRSGERVREFLWDLGASTGRLCAPHAARDLLTRAEHLPGLLHSLLGAAQSEKQRGSLASALHLCCGPGGWPGRETGRPLSGA